MRWITVKDMLSEQEKEKLDNFLEKNLEKPPSFGGDKEPNPYKETQRKDHRFWGLKRKKQR